MSTISFKHANSSDFRRRVTVVEGSSGEVPVILVEYWFESMPHRVEPKTNKYGKPFIPTLPSVLQSLKDSATTNPEKGPKTIFTEAIGDVTEKQTAEIPRNSKQVKFLIVVSAVGRSQH